MKFTQKLSAAAVSFLALGLMAAPVQAETLMQALREAYLHNPSLNAARAGQRATDENVPQALSGWRPTVGASVSAGPSWSYSTFPGAGGSAYGTPFQENLSIKLDQPLFRGFKTIESTATAEAQVKAGRQQLLSTEQTVLFNAAKAYIDLLRDRKIVALRQSDLKVQRGQAFGTNERFKAGVLTKTDVAQANAGIATAQAQLQLAIASVKADEATYAQYVGHMPGKLAPAPLARTPGSLDTALGIAGETNPNILAAAQLANAADHRVGVVGSALLPQADLVGTYSLSETQNGSLATPSSNSTLSIAGQVTVPIYEGGFVYSQVRQAKQLASQSHISVIDATRQVRQAVAAAWSSLVAARQAAASNRTGVSAAQLAYNGTRTEFQVGSRSTLDVLNAELVLLNAQLAQVNAEHDQLLASYQLQAAMGHLTALHLGMDKIYDVKDYYRDVRNKWIGFDAESKVK